MGIEYNYDGPPSLEIYQDFVRTSTASADTQSVVIVAEHYDVVKKDYNPNNIKPVAYDINTPATATWEHLRTTYESVDKDSVKVFMDDAVVAQATLEGTVIESNSNKIQLTVEVDDATIPVPIVIGDTVAVKAADDEKYEIAEVISIESAANTDTIKAIPVPGKENKGAGSFTLTGSYAGTKDRIYYIEVKSSSSDDASTSTGEPSYIIVDVTTNDGTDGASDLIVPIGSDAAVNLANSGLKIYATSDKIDVGCYYQVDVNAYGVGKRTIINLNKNIDKDANTKITVLSGKPYSTQVYESGYDVTSEGVVVKDLVLANIPMGNKELAACAVITGNVFTEYRAYTTKFINKLGYVEVSQGESIDSTVGYTGVENPLGAMVKVAMKGGTSVYCTAVKSDTLADYEKAFNFLSKSTDTYAIVIGSLRQDVIAYLSAFVNACAAPSVANYKIGYYGLDDTAEVCMWSTAKDANGKEKPIMATVENGVLTCNVSGFVTHDITSGDVIKMNIGVDEQGNPIFKTMVISSIINDTTCKVDGAESFTRPVNTVFSVYRTLEGSELVKALKNRVYNTNHRCFCVFGDGINIDDIEDAPAWLKAALPAGMRAGEYVQRPISNLSYDGCTATNKLNLSAAELKDLASRGVWILTNNTDGSVVYNYHQLSTDMSDKKLQEQSYTTNYDNISRGVRALMSPYYGNSNISEALFSKILADLHAFLGGKCTNAPSVVIGSQLVSYTGLRLEQDPVNRDHVYMYVDYDMPAPFNHVTVKQRLI